MKFFVLCALLGVLACPAFLQTKKPPAKGSAAKPKPAATPAKKPDDKAEWDRVTSIADRTERIDALEKFITSFPKTTHLNDAKGLIAAARVEAGNDDLAAGNVDAAVGEYKAAVAVVPTPVVQGFWDAGLSKIPANLYFRGRREAALGIAKGLEEKAGANSGQLLSLAGFYLTIEDGAGAKRISEAVIASEPASASAYRTLGLAERVQFRIEESAAAFAKSIELDPDSIDAKMGLAEMKRALGKPDEALPLYEAVIAKDAENVSARTGHVLALFDADRRVDAEAEMAKLLDDKPGDFLVLGEAAYWYAVHKDGPKAVELAQRAIAVEPRFVWSHIALARGLLLEDRVADAERTLIAARRYGNFPTLEYELAVTRLAAGYYREAAAGLATSFAVRDGQVTTALGGRVLRGSKEFIDLVADERRASIFAPVAADDPDMSARLTALLAFKTALDVERPDEKAVAAAADEFAKGDDRMQVHRQLYAASELLERKIALQTAVELAKAAVPGVEAGLTSPTASTAVMANELYSPRAIAATRGEYINVPEVPRATLSSIMRGRIEDIIGWASYQNGSSDEAVIHLRRAISVLPPDSAWWRSSTWHLGAALASSGKDTEALQMYILSYKGSQPDAIRYSVIEGLYRKVNGSADGLTDKIGDNPAEAARTPTPSASPEPTATATPIPTPAPTPDMVSAIPIATPTPTPQPTATPEVIPTPQATPSPDAAVTIAPSPTPILEPTPSATQTPTPTPGPLPTTTPEATPVPQPSPTGTPAPTVTPTPTPEPSPSMTPEVRPSPDPSAAQTVVTEKPSATPDPTAQAKTHDLFPPIVITVPSAKTDTSAAPAPKETPASTRDATPCALTVSSDVLRLNRSGGSQAVIVGREDNGEIDALEAVSTTEVALRREPVVGVSSRALFVIRAVTAKAGLYHVTFKLPCGSRTIEVSVH